MKPSVSVIVTTKNSAKTVLTSLESIREQTYPDIEIIIVDNSSKDNTKKIAETYTSHIFNHGPERSAQRNYGAAKSKGGYLLFLDSDMELSPKIIEECVRKIEKFDALYIPEIISGDSLWSQVRSFERSFYNKTVIDAVRFIRKDIFLKVGGFDEALTGPEDWDFDKKVRNSGKTGIIQNPLYHHEEQVTIHTYINKKLYYSESFDRYICKWGSEDTDIKKQFGLYYRFIGVFIEDGKWKMLLSKPHLSILMYLLKLYLGIRFVIKKTVFTQPNSRYQP